MDNGKKPRQKRFRLLTNELSITYARCPLTIQQIVVHLKHVCKTWSYICVSQESHKDGCLHLHAHLQLSVNKDIQNERMFDYTVPLEINKEDIYHPSIEKTVDTVEWNEYIKKNGVYEEDGQIVVLSTGGIRTKKLSNEYLINKDLIEMIDKEEIELVQLPSVLKAKNTYLGLKRAKERSLKVKPTMLETPWGIQLVINSEKKSHYWVWSTKPNYGKTTWLQCISEKYRAAYYKAKCDMQDVDADVDFVLVDGNKVVPYDDLEQMCDGTHQYRIPYIGVRPLINKPTVIICCNRSIDVAYPYMADIIKARFTEIALDGLCEPFI